MKATFTTTIFQAEGKNAAGIRVPEEIVASLGKGKRPPVKVTLAGYTYRSTVAVYGDAYLSPAFTPQRFRRESRRHARNHAGVGHGIARR